MHQVPGRWQGAVRFAEQFIREYANTAECGAHHQAPGPAAKHSSQRAPPGSGLYLPGSAESTDDYGLSTDGRRKGKSVALEGSLLQFACTCGTGHRLCFHISITYRGMHPLAFDAIQQTNVLGREVCQHTATSASIIQYPKHAPVKPKPTNQIGFISAFDECECSVVRFSATSIMWADRQG